MAKPDKTRLQHATKCCGIIAMDDGYPELHNVVEQSRRYDPMAEYISHWCPELAELPIAVRFAPWAARMAVPDYPVPIKIDPGW